MSKFNIGDLVESTVNTQGLKKGARYEVVDSRTTRSFLGGYTFYDLLPVDGTPDEIVNDVGNGHLLLTLISEATPLKRAHARLIELFQADPNDPDLEFLFDELRGLKEEERHLGEVNGMERHSFDAAVERFAQKVKGLDLGEG